MPSTEDTTRLTILGTGSCCPPPGGEVACFLLNDDVLIDTGWNVAAHMRRFGCDPLAVRTVFITHCHHDHYMGLASLLFYHAMADHGRRKEDPPTIVGPRTEIRNAVDRALHFLQNDRYGLIAPPNVVPLPPGGAYETDRFGVRTAQTIHPTLCLAYRFEDKLTGAVAAFSGDTAPHGPLARLAAGADVLCHEASLGAQDGDPLAEWGHAGTLDAARTAAEAGCKRLCLVHHSDPIDEATLARAREIFPATTVPEEGDVIDLPIDR
jgi:ribonuclease Z